MTDFPNRPRQSNFEVTLAQPIDSSGTTIILSDVPDYASGGETTIFTILNPKGVEHISATGWNGSTNTLSGVVRGVVGYDGGSSTAAAHGAGTKVILGNPWQVYDEVNTGLASKADLAGDTFTGRASWSGTNAAPNVPTFADTTARDAAITTPVDGDLCTVAGDLQHYNATTVQWETADTGTPTPNGSTTVAGKFEEATTAEVGASTATGGTGARLAINPGSVVKTSSGAGDENKLAALDSNGEFAAGFLGKATLKSTLTAKGSIYAASAASTPAELAAGSDNQVIVYDSGETTGLNASNFSKLIFVDPTRGAFPDGQILAGATETVLNETIPANSFGANDILFIKTHLDMQVNSTTSNVTIDIKFGGTNIASFTESVSTSVLEQFFVETYIYAVASTASQLCVTKFGQLDQDNTFSRIYTSTTKSIILV